MSAQTLTLRQLNRATLARQLLLQRETRSVPATVEQIVGMQAQLAQAPFIGLWTRLEGFQRDDLARLLHDHTIVKATMMRATLHLVTADDFVRLRPTLQPMLDAAAHSIVKDRGEVPPIETLLALVRDFLHESPRSFAEITDLFTERFPDVDPGAMRYSVRMQLPLVQVPTEGGWSYPGNPKFTLAESWLTHPLDAVEDFRALVLRYLAAFGPARVTDLQTWSGLGKLKSAVDALKPQLQLYRDEQGVELLDLPDMPLPDADTPAPVRFLPEFDNILLSHSNRTRIVADDYRRGVYLPGLRVAATFLVDGFVQGAWKVEKAKSVATLTLTPFTPLDGASRAALTDEAEQLVRFMEPDAKSHAVRFADA
jgi:hypothetical protein